MPVPRITVMGRLADDPALKILDSGKAVARLRMVGTDRRKNDAGEWVDGDQCWITANVWGSLAEHCNESLRKGDECFVHGRLVTSEWTDAQTGAKRSALVIQADAAGPTLHFRVTRHGDQHGDQPTGSSEAAHAPQAAVQQTSSADDPWATPGASSERHTPTQDTLEPGAPPF